MDMASTWRCPVCPSHDLAKRRAVRGYRERLPRSWVPGHMMIRRPLSLARSEGFWGVASLLVVGFVMALYVLGVGSERNKLVAAVAINQKRISVNLLSCLSIRSRDVVFDRKEYWDLRLAGEIANKLSVKAVLPNADYEACRWGVFATVVPGEVRAVTYNGEVAQYLVSIGVCERAVDGSMNPNECVNKNVYVFNQSVEPRDLFSLALVGLAKSQADEWETFKSERSQ